MQTQPHPPQPPLTVEQLRLRSLYEATPAMLHATDAEGRLTMVSDTWLVRLGYRRDEVLGRPAHEFMTATCRERLRRDAWPTLLAQGRVEGLDCELVVQQGGVMRVLLSAILERNADGSTLRTLAVSEDITRRQQAEQSLAEERQRLNNIIAGTQVGTWEWNIQTGELRLNERWAEMVGHTLAELQPLSTLVWSERQHPDDKPLSRERMRRHLAGLADGYESEVRMRHRDGHWIWVMDRGRVLTWTADGKPEWMFGTRQDVTARMAEREAVRSTLERLALATQSGGIGIFDWDLTTNQLTWDARMYRLYGVPPEEGPITYERWVQTLDPQSRAVGEKIVADAIAVARPIDVEFQVRWPDGSHHVVKSSARVEHNLAGEPVRVIGANWDITEPHRLAAELAEQHELLRVTLQSIGDAVITTDAAGRVVWLNPVAARMTGWSTDDAVGQPLGSVYQTVDETTGLHTEDPVAMCLAQKSVTGSGSRAQLRSRSGQLFSVEDSAAPIRHEQGRILGVVLVFRDVTEQRRLSSEMHHRATHDALTGLVNRTEFEARLSAVLSSAQQDGSSHALLYIDLDQFKLVNDACGHAVGDQLLRQVAEHVGHAMRASDTLARMGGDEFGVILQHCPTEQALRVAQDVCDRMEAFRFEHDGRRFRIGASIGLVPVDQRWASAAAILQAADTSCYAAKEAGRNRVHAWFDTDVAMRARHGEMQWANRIEQALDEDRFVLFAQRIESLQGASTGVYAEVLLRLVQPDGTLALPGAFLPAAERFHLASRIDRWVLRHAIAWMASLPSLAVVDNISVNLSGQSIGDRAFHAWALATLADAGPALCCKLSLEITETAAVTNLADAAVFIEQVRSVGVKVALDDFGAGASSFGYLKQLRVDVLKIDGQFIRDVVDDPLDEAAVRCFADVAKVVGLKTVAEFVDKPAVLERLRAIGIDYAQGFLLHRPIPIETLLGQAAAVVDETASL